MNSKHPTALRLAASTRNRGRWPLTGAVLLGVVLTVTGGVASANAVADWSQTALRATVGGTGNSPGELEAAVIAIDGCEHCADLIASGEADLVVTTTLADGSYVAVWKSKADSRVHGQIYTRDGWPRGAQFRIHADVEVDYLPIIHMQSNGEFVARWQHLETTYERRFDAFGRSLGAEARSK